MTKYILKDVEGFQKRSDLFHVDPGSIIVLDSWNDRTDFSGEQELMDSIKENGVLKPLDVKKTKDKKLELVDGERRLRAVRKLIQSGTEIKSIPVIVYSSKVNEMELYLASLIGNTGKPLTPSEEANGFKRLLNYGFSVKDISKKVGRSDTHVRNRLELSYAIPPVKKAVDEKKITQNAARKIVKESDGKYEKQQQMLIEEEDLKDSQKNKTITFNTPGSSNSILKDLWISSDHECETIKCLIFDKDLDEYCIVFNHQIKKESGVDWFIPLEKPKGV